MTLPTNRSINSTAAEHVTDHNTVHGFYNTHPADPAAHSGTYELLPSGIVSGTNAGITLKDWAQGECYEATALTRDANDAVTTATVKWPDGSAGTFTATTINATWNTVDAYTVSHTSSGLTVTQAAVTRNANGAVTVKPALTVA